MNRLTTPIDELRAIGQSVWLDFLRRGLVTSGELDRMMRDGCITGMTSNPTILLKAISGSSDYDQALRKIAEGGECTPYDAFLELGGEDIRMAADVMRPVFDETRGRDGYISFEAQAGGPDKMMTEVRRMFSTVGRPNVMIKVPGTQAGVQAVAPLIAEGININITLLFDVDVYVQFARAYIEGLRRRLDRGLPLDTVASVASFSPDSQTETFVALELCIDNWRWAGVPVYLRAGKRLPRRATEIKIGFRDAFRSASSKASV